MPETFPAAAGLYDFVFFCVVWFAGAITGVLATFIAGDRRQRTSWYVLAVGALSGLVAYAFVAFLSRTAGGTVGHEPMYVGMAIGIGALGKLNLKMVYFIVHSVLKRVGIDVDDTKVINDKEAKA